MFLGPFRSGERQSVGVWPQSYFFLHFAWFGWALQLKRSFPLPLPFPAASAYVAATTFAPTNIEIMSSATIRMRIVIS
jgi:hypothetical protein